MGELSRDRVKIDVNKKLYRFSSIINDGKKQWYQLRYEKLPVFCGVYGMFRHWYQECGARDHDKLELEWGILL
jgi:hypothetical protein